MASPLTLVLLEQLVRVGILEADEIDEMAAKLDAEGHKEDAHLCRLAFVEANAPTQADWEAERRRSRMHVISDGGNSAE